MTLLLLIVLVIVLAGGGYGWRAGAVTYANPLGLVLMVLLIVLLLGLVLPVAGVRWYP